MSPLVIAGAVATYLVLALLLLSLNIASLWKWWIKAGAIVVTLAGAVVIYLSMTGLIGWSSQAPLPKRFSLLSTRIVEPDKLRGLPGHIYLWVEEVDEHQVVTTPPRAYEVPYVVETATDVASAQKQIEGGGKVLGEFAATGSQQATAATTLEKPGDQTPKDMGAMSDTQSNGGGGGGETIGDPGALSFSEMPPVDLPDKGAMTMVGN